MKSDIGRRIEDCIFGDVLIWQKDRGEQRRVEMDLKLHSTNKQEKVLSSFPSLRDVPEDEKVRETNQKTDFYSYTNSLTFFMSF